MITNYLYIVQCIFIKTNFNFNIYSISVYSNTYFRIDFSLLLLIIIIILIILMFNYYSKINVSKVIKRNGIYLYSIMIEFKSITLI